MNHDQRLELAFKSLKGTSIGDAFGDSFFGSSNEIHECIRNRKLPETQWEFTDDTVMAIAVYKQLSQYKSINQDELAAEFSKNHQLDPNRGYGASARKILREISEGGNWMNLSSSVFDGMGSMGNGAAMRCSSIGAYYHDNIKMVKELAAKSAEITHMNTEGITGAVAVALATANATQIRQTRVSFSPNEFINEIAKELPDSDTKSKILKSLSVPYSYNIETVRAILGDGSKILAQDTVPFSIWCAAHNLCSFKESLWKAITILGDRDTIGAIVGGITIMSSPFSTVPQEWLDCVEKIENSLFW